jgi:hypothetical protein
VGLLTALFSSPAHASCGHYLIPLDASSVASSDLFDGQSMPQPPCHGPGCGQAPSKSPTQGMTATAPPRNSGASQYVLTADGSFQPFCTSTNDPHPLPLSDDSIVDGFLSRIDRPPKVAAQ